MEVVCGTQLSHADVDQLLSYLDADGDGRVGLGDFKQFMSTGSVAEIDAKSCMWSADAKDRQEPLSASSAHRHQQHERLSVFDEVGPPASSAWARRGSSPPRSKASDVSDRGTPRRVSRRRSSRGSHWGSISQPETPLHVEASRRSDGCVDASIESALASYEQTMWERLVDAEAAGRR